MSARMFGVYVHSYDHARSESFWKYVTGPFSKSRAEEDMRKQQRARPVSDFRVFPYQGERIAMQHRSAW